MTAPSTTPLIQLQGLGHAYGGRPTLSGLTVALHRGSIGLLGPNGAGKTTLIRCLLGLIDPAHGQLRVLGLDPRTEAPKIRQRVGYMPENEAYFADLSGYESVVFAARLCGLPRSEAIRRAHEVLDYAGLDEARYRPMAGYSTGMKQRVKLAQAIVHGPEVVFLDEPTNGLDPQGRDDMLALLSQLSSAGVSVMLSTHILGDVERVCSHVMMLAAGELKFYGPLAELTAGAAGEYVVQVKSGRDTLATALEAAGLVVSRAESPLELRVALASADIETFWRLSLASGVQVRHFGPEQLSLEDAFLRVLGAAA